MLKQQTILRRRGAYEAKEEICLRPDPPSVSTKVLMTRKRAASGRFCTSLAENIGITNTKAFVAARIPMGQPH
jgi:hypothetical protein